MSRKFTVLTRAAQRTLGVGQKLQEHGVIVERLRDGDLRFSINVMVDGERVHRVIGRHSDGITREQAERAIESFRTKAREGRLELPSGRKTHRGFGDAAEDYLTRITHHPKHGRNLGRKQQHIRQRLAPYFKHQRLDKITEVTVSLYVSHRKAEGAAQATINRELSSLSHFLNRCFEWGWTKARPKIDKGEERRKQILVLSDAEKQALMHAATVDQDSLTWLFVAVAMGTGMRHSEILRMQWQEIDFAHRRIFIGRAKAGQRQQPMPPSLAAALEKEWHQLGRPQGYVFPTSRPSATHPHRQDMAKQFRRTVSRANLDPTKVTPHILRHTAITSLVKAGVDIPTIQEVSGHKTLAMVLRYTHLSNEHVDRAVAALDTDFPDAITPKLHTDLGETAKEGA